MQRGDVVRPSDGSLLFWQRASGIRGEACLYCIAKHAR